MIGDNTTHANFSVDDLDAAKDFYVNKLGFDMKMEKDGDMMLESGSGTRVNIYLRPDHHAADFTVLGIEVDNVAGAAEELKSRGIAIENTKGANSEGIVEDSEMGEVAWFKDPAGNWLCVNHMTMA